MSMQSRTEATKMPRHFSMILRGLFISTEIGSRDLDLLELFRISHILSITSDPGRVYKDRCYLCVKAQDDINQDLMQYFSVCNDFIHATRVQYKNVLVHCVAGISRSVTLTIAYIMTVCDLPWQVALKVVVARRQGASPNIGFLRQLKKFQKHHLQAEQLRLAHCFQYSPISDQAKCNAILRDYDASLTNPKNERGYYTFGLASTNGAETDLTEQIKTRKRKSRDSDDYSDSDNESDSDVVEKPDSKIKKKATETKAKHQKGRKSVDSDLMSVSCFIQQQQLSKLKVSETDDLVSLIAISKRGEQIMPNVRLYRQLF